MDGRLCVEHASGINSLRAKSGRKLFSLKTLTENRGGGGRMTTRRIQIIGGGLAGPEAALQAANAGCEVTLFEMRPTRSTEAHQTADFAELVCSNSLKSESENTAPWLLKQEMRRAGSFLLQAADASAVPAGHALAVDRTEFSRHVAELIEQHPRITIKREEITRLDENDAD